MSAARTTAPGSVLSGPGVVAAFNFSRKADIWGNLMVGEGTDERLDRMLGLNTHRELRGIQ